MKCWVIPAGLSCALALVLIWELGQGNSDADAFTPVLQQQGAASAVAAPTLDAGLVSAAAATALARPVFSPTRRPATEPNATVAPPPAKDAVPRLAGIIISPSGRRAIFADAAGHAHTATEGGQVGRFTVSAIRPGQVTVTSSEGERVLRPSFANAGPAAASTADSRPR